jgi:hypothetical protein
MHARSNGNITGNRAKTADDTVFVPDRNPFPDKGTFADGDATLAQFGNNCCCRGILTAEYLPFLSVMKIEYIR